MDYLDLTILELHEALLANKVTPLELTLLAIRKAKENRENAFEYICEKEAIEIVKNLDPNKKNNLLWGIPFILKDNFSTKDIPTTGSSNILNGYVPVFSSEVYNKLINQGAILIGKTTLDELGMGGTGTNGHKGITYNPWDKSHTHLIGGSSSGSAASVAAGIVPLGIGTDTGDSVRKPAGYAGLVGFKPTWGLISRYGVFPFAPSLDHVAFFTRSIKDSALTLDVLQGKDEKDMTSMDKPLVNHLDNISSDIKGKKIAVIDEIVSSITDQKIKETYFNTLDALKAKGAIINHVSLDERLCKALYPTYIIISSAESTSNNANLDGVKFGHRFDGKTYEEVMKKARSNGFSDMVKRRFVIGGYALNQENQDRLYLQAQKARHIIVNRVNEILSENDVIYLPASPTVAPLISSISGRIISSNTPYSENHLVIGNFAGLPSLTVPIGFKDGLPFGGNFTGRAFDEQTVLNFSLALEEIAGLKNIIAKGEK